MQEPNQDEESPSRAVWQRLTGIFSKVFGGRKPEDDTPKVDGDCGTPPTSVAASADNQEEKQQQQESQSGGTKPPPSSLLDTSDGLKKPPPSADSTTKSPPKKRGRKRKQEQTPTDTSNDNASKLDRMVQQTHQQVMQAGRLVAQALSSGPWPSPMRCCDEDELDGHVGSYDQHLAHMSLVGACIKQFCQDTISPAMVQPLWDEGRRRGRRKLLLRRRPFIGSLLMSREVLIQNADNVFGRLAVLLGRKEETSTEEYESLQQMPYSILLTDPAVLFGVRCLVTAVILHGLDGQSQQQQENQVAFLEAVQAYDERDESFVDSLASVHVPSLQPVVKRGEAVTDPDPWRASFGLHQSRHPLSRRARGVLVDTVPEAHAVHVTVLQKDTKVHQKRHSSGRRKSGVADAEAHAVALPQKEREAPSDS